jgi:hypothetical protein
MGGCSEPQYNAFINGARNIWLPGAYLNTVGFISVADLVLSNGRQKNLHADFLYLLTTAKTDLCGIVVKIRASRLENTLFQSWVG